MLSSIFQDYEKVNTTTNYIGLFFVGVLFLALFTQPDPSMVGVWISVSVFTVAMAVSIYNDVQHKKYDKLKKRALGGFGVVLITVIYLIFFFNNPL